MTNNFKAGDTAYIKITEKIRGLEHYFALNTEVKIINSWIDENDINYTVIGNYIGGDYNIKQVVYPEHLSPIPIHELDAE